MVKNDVSNTADIIDSRDVIARIDELESELADLIEATEAEDYQPSASDELQQWHEDYDDELKALKALADEAEGAGDWRHGETLIRDSYFEEYAQQLADDIGAVKNDAGWPNSYIDWKAAAEALQMDYTSVDFDGVTYWIRS